MGVRDIINPRLMGSLGAFAPNTVTIQVNTPTRASNGEEIPSWANVSGLVDLTCRIDPAKGREVKREDGKIAIITHEIMIYESQPTITQRHRAIAGGKTYDIVNPQNNAELTHTVLQVELVE